MKAILLLICRSRFHVPRVGGFVHSAQFAAFTHPYQPFVFEGRALDMDEFNVAATRLLDVRNTNLGYEVSVRMVPAELPVEEIPVAPTEELPPSGEPVTDSPEVPLDEVEVNEGPAPDAPGSPEWTAPEPGTEYKVAVDPSSDPNETSSDDTSSSGTFSESSSPPAFALEGSKIMLDGQRIAGLFGEDKQLRVTAAHTALRPQIEAWLLTLTPSDQ